MLTRSPQGSGRHFEGDMDVFNRSGLDLRGVDLVEMVPQSSRVSEMVAARLLQKIISFWGKAHGCDRKPQIGSQTQVVYD